MSRPVLWHLHTKLHCAIRHCLHEARFTRLKMRSSIESILHFKLDFFYANSLEQWILIANGIQSNFSCSVSLPVHRFSFESRRLNIDLHERKWKIILGLDVIGLEDVFGFLLSFIPLASICKWIFWRVGCDELDLI